MSTTRGLVAMIGVLAALSHVNAAGQETDKLLRDTTGFLLLHKGGSGIEAIQFPTLKKTIVRPDPSPPKAENFTTLHSWSGPDSGGRIAFIEDHFFVKDKRDRRHDLKAIGLDGTQETTLFSRPGDAMWAASAAGKGQIGRSLALSPVGGRVAFHTDLAPVQLPNCHVYCGSIEFWNLESKQNSKINANAMNASLAWLPDGKRLVYVKLADPKITEIVASSRNDVFLKKFQNWEKIPSVFIRDVDTGKEAFLHVGMGAIVSPNGRQALVFDNEGAWIRVDVATGESSHVAWHDHANKAAGIISYLTNDILLVSTTTWKPQPKRRGFLSSFDPPISIRTYSLVRLNSDEFQILAIDDSK
jgi:hypothetical protein